MLKPTNRSNVFHLLPNSLSLSLRQPASSISRNEEMNHDFLCANHAYDTNDCQIYARDKWGEY